MSNKKYVTYEEFGAVGDGVTDDFAAIKKAHDYANEAGLPVKANDNAHYYIHYANVDGNVEIVKIKTPVQWGKARFTIDDTDISPVKGDPNYEYAHIALFQIESPYPMVRIADKELLLKVAEAGIKPGTKKIDLGLGYPAMIVPYLAEMSKRVYRRQGYGGFSGSPRHEVIVLDKDGNVSDETPIMFDYPSIDYIEVYRDDIEELVVEGGVFTTLACQVNVLRDIGNGMTDEMGGYINRGIKVIRSHTTVKGTTHYVEGEIPLKEQIKDGEYVKIGTTYNGFFSAVNANHVTFLDCTLTGRRCYGRPKHCKTGGTGGTYDFSAAMVNKIVLKNCHQTNFWIKYDENLDITPAKEGEPGAVPSIMLKKIQGLNVKVIWGIGGTNFCKNMEYIDSTLSRFDAHSGLYNGKIINSSVNVMALTGVGDMIVENSKWFAADPGYTFNAVFHFRGDYGSTWKGDMKIKNLKAYFFNNENISFYMHGFSNWYFGYDCYVPNLCIDGLEAFYIEDMKPMPAGKVIKLMGSSIIREPALHLPKTKKVEATYPYVDFDGDGIIDGTNVPYDAEFVKNSNAYQAGIKCGSYANVNRITPPAKVEAFNVKGGVKIGLAKTHLYEDCEGGFLANTEFSYEKEKFVGTDHEENEVFTFLPDEEFFKMYY